MSSRLSFESWQMLFPAIGFVLFVLAFIFISVRAWRMRKSSVDHLGHLPLEGESPRPASHVRSASKKPR